MLGTALGAKDGTREGSEEAEGIIVGDDEIESFEGYTAM